MRRIVREANIPVVIGTDEQDLPCSVVAFSNALRNRAHAGVHALQWTEESARRRSGSDLAYVIFTSGSTGAPKGVAMEHKAVCNTLDSVNRMIGVTPADRVLCVSKLTFDLSVYDIFGILGAGGAIVCPDAARANDPSHWLELIDRLGVTVWNSVPTAAQMLEEAAGRLGRECLLAAGGLRFLLSGDRIPPALPQRIKTRFPGASVISLGGATECAIWSIVYPIEQDTSDWISVPYGSPLPNQRFYVLDAQLEPVAPGALGELFIAGDGLARGYFQDPARTAEVFLFHEQLGERLYRTGDVGRHLPDGTIEFVGRNDNQVKIRGHRVEIGEIEACIRSCEGVGDAVVVMHEDQSGRHLLAYIVTADGRRADLDRLRQYLYVHLPTYMVPRGITQVDEFPLSSNGKLDRSRLPAPGTDAYAHAEFRPPRSGVEAELAQLWASMLGVQGVGVDDNFFALGGDSVSAMRMIAVWNRQGNELSVADFYGAPTIAEMTRRSRGRAPGPELAAGAGVQPLLPAQAWLLAKQDVRFHRFNQSIAVRVPANVAAANVERVLRSVVSRHDAFRLRFEKTPTAWSSHYAEDSSRSLKFVSVDLSGYGSAEQEVRRAEQLEAAQAAINVVEGPTLVTVYIRRSQSDCSLVLIATHLVVDAVSWSTILLDLAAHLRDPDGAIGPSSNGLLLAWTDYLRSVAGSERFLRTVPFWLAQLEQPRIGIPFDEPGAPSLSRESAYETLTYSRWLELRDGGRTAWSATALELVLCATFMGFRDWTQENRLPLMVEHHGRESFPGGSAIAHAVGWFTAYAPLELSSATEDAPQVVAELLSQIRARPDSGLSYSTLRYVCRDDRLCAAPEPQIWLNFLGDVSGGKAGSVSLSAEHTGSSQASDASRLFEIALNVSIDDRGLHVGVDYCTARLTRRTVKRLLRAFTGAFAELEAAAASLDDDGGAAGGVDEGTVPAGPRRLGPATASQQGMLLHGEIDRATAVYVNQMRVRLGGRVDERKLKAACQYLLERHDALRISFHEGEDGKLYLVQNEGVVLTWESHTLAGLPAQDEARAVQEIAQSVRQQGFTPDVPPLMRIAAIRVGENDLWLVWTYHHALFDGWSLSILLRELIDAYRQLCESDTVSLPPAPRFGRYLDWLYSREGKPALEHWTGLLSGYNPPRALQLGAASGLGAAMIVADTSPEEAFRLKAVAKRLRVTVSVIVQSAWAYALARYYAVDDIVFGLADSGRSSGVDDSERMVGPLLNVLPVRARVNESTTGEELIASLFSQLRDGAKFTFASLAEIKAAVRPGQYTLFETIVAFENYHLRNDANSAPDVRIADVAHEEGTHYPIALIASIDDSARFGISFRRERFSEESVRRLLTHFTNVLFAICDGPGRPLLDVDTLFPTEMEAVRLADRASKGIPMDGDGKLDRSQLPEVEASDDGLAPRDGLEAGIAEIWTDVLGQPVQSREANFFDLGGHSLKLAQVISRIRATFQKEAEFGALYSSATIAAQAGYLRSLETSAEHRVQALSASARRAGVPLTRQQAGLWYLCQDKRLNAAYNIPMLALVNGEIDRGAMHVSMAQLVERHEVLRTVLKTDSDLPLQSTIDAIPSQVQRITVTNEAEAAAACADITEHCFDWRSEPLFKARLIECSDGRTWIAINVHHLVFDAWSMSVLLEDLAHLYARNAGTSSEPCEPLSIQFGDYAAWAAAEPQVEDSDASAKYWRDVLAGYTGILPLQTDYARPARQSFQGDAVRIEWDPEVSAMIERACRQLGVTPFMLLFAGLALVVSGISDSEDIVIGALNSGRDPIETESLIGLFAGMLPIRVRVDYAQDAEGFIGEVRQTLLRALEHANSPFERVIDLAGVRRPADRMALVQVAFTFQNVPDVLPGGLEFSNQPLARRTAKFDFSLTLRGGRDGYRGELEYDKALFRRETIEAYSAYLLTVIERLCTQRDAPLDQIHSGGEEGLGNLCGDACATERGIEGA
jgi:amino acid adenylation domain-containing protein/non-ribosomal peptide synthase protein (TIGR01720 family)